MAQKHLEERDYVLANAVRFFVARMAPEATDQEQLAEKLRSQRRVREVDPLHRTRYS